MNKQINTFYGIFLTSLLNLISININAQYYPIKQYSVKEGLEQYQINDLFLGKQHYLWIGTKGGVSIFDGVNFINIGNTKGLLGSEVIDITNDDSEQVWILTHKGLNKIINFKPIPYNLGIQIDSFSKFNHFAYDKKKELFYLGLETKTEQNEVYIWNKKKLWNIKDSINLDKIKGKIDQWTLNTPQFLFAFTKYKNTERIYKLNYQNKKIENYGYSTIRYKIAPNLFVYDSAEYLYFCNPSKLHFIFKKPESNFFIFKNGLGNYQIYKKPKLYPTMKGNLKFPYSKIVKYKETIFIGDEYGLTLLGNRAFIHIKSNCTKQKVHNIWAVSELKGNFYFFSYRENSYIYHTKEKKLSTQKEIKSYYFGWNYLDKNKIIVGNSEGYSIITPITHKNIIDEQRRAISFIYKDKKNKDLYLCHTGGISILHQNGKFTDYFNRNGADLGYPLCITKDKYDSLWIVGNYRVRKFKNGRFTDIKRVLNKTGAFCALTDDRKNLWFGGKAGLLFYNYKHFRQIKHPHLKTIVTALYQIDKQRLLIGTSKGLAMLNLKLFYEKDSIFVQWFDQCNGFATEECQQNSFFKDSKGFIWIPIVNEVIKIDTAFLSFNTQKPLAIIQYIQTQKNNKKYFPSHQSISLKKNDRNLQFHYTAIEYQNPYKIKFSYRLLGLCDKWSHQTNEKYINFTNLNAQKYTFQLIAYNENGASSQKVSLTFTIKKYWYEFISVKLLIIFIIITIVIFITRYSYYKKEKEKIETRLLKEKYDKLQSQNLIGLLDHHFLFNSINASAKSAFELQPKALYESMAKLANLLRYILRRNDVLNVSLFEEINQIDNFIALQKTRFKERLEFIKEIESIDKLMQIQIPRLFIYHFIENAIKYSIEETGNTGKIILRTYNLDKNYCIVKIEDDGIGEKSKLLYKASTGIGIQSNKDLIKILNQSETNKYKIKFKLVYKEAPQHGMIVIIWLPINFDYYIGE